MKIAILIGVSDYFDSSNNLPGCKNDMSILQSAVIATSKFDEILFINDNTDSVNIKQRLSNFIAKNNEKPIEELFFYYTGHGEFYNNEFYYVLSDFDKKRRKQTTLENSELDEMFRSMNPQLVIKVVDACQAGITYIKGDNSFEKYLKDSEGHFKKCYFMFSSQIDQSSYQTDISQFTKSFIDALINHPSEEIRYKDIIDYVSDDFSTNATQTPFFIIQGNFTEKFGTFDTEAKKALSNFFIHPSQEEKDEQHKERKLSLIELVKMDAQVYCSKEEVLESLIKLQESITNFQYSSDLNSIYNIEYNFRKSYTDNRLRESYAPRLDIIGKWLKENSHEYFASPIIETETYEVDNPISALFSSSRKNIESREVIKGFHSTVDLPYRVITIDATPKYSNLAKVNCAIVFICSKTSIRFFYFCAVYLEESWGYYSLPTDVKWKSVDCKLKDYDQVEATLKSILNDFSEFILIPIKDKFIKATKETELQAATSA